jgi:acylphosphatase
VSNSGFTDEEVILELYKKMTDRAQKVTKYVLESGADEYATVKDRLIDHFHGDETAEKYLKKFKKASRKPGEKIYDFAIRLKEIFKYAYPDAYTQDSFQIILQQKFIDGLDEKLQMKVKYKAFKTFDELVSEARKYSIRLETIEGSKGIQEFVNVINKPPDSKLRESLEMVELKQLVEKQNESVNALVAALKDGSKPVVATGTEQSEMSSYIQELSKAVDFLFKKSNEQTHQSNKHVSFQLPGQQGMNQFGSSYHPPTSYNSQQNKPFHGKPNWQPRPQYQQANQQFRPPSYSPSNPPFSPNQSIFRPPRSDKICDFCKLKGHSKDVCFRYQRIMLENAQPPICYMCRQIGHLAYQCPKRSQIGNPNLPGPPPNQGNN